MINPETIPALNLNQSAAASANSREVTNNQELLDNLSEIESYLFYEIDDDQTQNTANIDPEKLRAFHATIKKALETWFMMTRCRPNQ